MPFLYETIDQISADGEDELDRLALAIERVLPKDVRLNALARRKAARLERRATQREARRQQMIVARAQRRALRDAERARAGVLYQSDFPVWGAMRFAERRDACERLLEDDDVALEREPDNSHDSNAILVLGTDDCELGYVPREEASAIAPLLDAGAEASARVKRLWETGHVVMATPVVLAETQDFLPVSSDCTSRSLRCEYLRGTPQKKSQQRAFICLKIVASPIDSLSTLATSGPNSLPSTRNPTP